MNRSATRSRTALAMTLMASGGLSVASFALAAGIAQAETVTVIPDAAAQTIVDLVSNSTGFVPNDVTCPSGVEATVGEQFECQFTGPEGPYTAYMQITKVKGTYVEYAITTLRD